MSRRRIKLGLKDRDLWRDPEVRRWIRSYERHLERKMEAEMARRLTALMSGLEGSYGPA